VTSWRKGAYVLVRALGAAFDHFDPVERGGSTGLLITGDGRRSLLPEGPGESACQRFSCQREGSFGPPGGR
jgi:hypothetical protein